MITTRLKQAFEQWENKIAITDMDSEYTYSRLMSDAVKVSRTLQAKQIAPGDRVGIYVERSYKAIAAMLGIMNQGAVYVPINKDNPLERTKSIIRLCGMKALIMDDAPCDSSFDDGDGQPEGFLVIDINDVLKSEEALASDMALFEAEPDQRQSAYILYTSGSTGVPKGVSIPYEAFGFFVDWASKEFQISAEDHIVGISALTFDLSVFDIYVSLVTGATLHIAPDSLKRWPGSFTAFLEEKKISVMYAVPSFLNLLVLYGSVKKRDLGALRTVLFAGEHYAISQFNTLFDALPKGIQYANLYGPTETNVCTFYRLPEDYDRTMELPIGKVLPGLSYMIDAKGELIIFGPAVMKYYWGETKTRDEAHWYKHAGGYGYRTGDLVSQTAGGDLVLLGRKDDMVKVKGYRISLNEIKSILMQIEHIENAYVGVYTIEGNSEIAAFVKAKEAFTQDASKDFELQVYNALRARLAPYMLPQKLILVQEMPFTASGKVDGKKLIGSLGAVK